MAIKCDQHCGECEQAECISFQINARLLEEIKQNNRGRKCADVKIIPQNFAGIV